MSKPPGFYYLGKNREFEDIPFRSRSASRYNKMFGEHISTVNVKGKMVADVGAGFAGGVNLLASRGASVLGVDPAYADLDLSELEARTLAFLDDLEQKVQVADMELQYIETIWIREQVLKRLTRVFNPYFWRQRSAEASLEDFKGCGLIGFGQFLAHHHESPGSYRNASVKNLRLDNDSVDLYLSSWLFPFHFRKDPESFVQSFREMMRVLSPAGKAVLFPAIDEHTGWVNKVLAKKGWQIVNEEASIQQGKILSCSVISPSHS